MKYDDKMMKIFLEFIVDRQKIFYRKFLGYDQPWTNNEIFRTYKFTNVWRSSDRVSQYLIRDVIYNPSFSTCPEDVLLRILIYKFFNLESTWETIIKNIGEPKVSTFDFKECARSLDNCGKLYNNAYMMAGQKSWGYDRKHWNNLCTIDHAVKEGLTDVVKSDDMKEVFDYLMQFPLISTFLAYQFAVDINYSMVMNCNENSFVYPGSGTVRGIARMFGLSLAEVRKSGEALIEEFVWYQDEIASKFEVELPTLFGRELFVPDVANCFCEFDKICRVMLPDQNSFGMKRIKQKYTPSTRWGIAYLFPPKWGIDHDIDTMKVIAHNELL